MTAAVPWWGAAWRQFRLERRMFWRNPSAAFFGVLLPLGLLAIFGAVFAGQDEDLDVIVPGIAALSMMSATFTSLAYNLTTLRERGILKRLRGTPMPTSAYLAGLAGNAVANAALQLVIVILAGHFLLGVTWPQDWGSMAVFAAAGVDLLHVPRRGARARHPEPRIGARVRQRRLPAADPDRGRLLRRGRGAADHPRHRAGPPPHPFGRRSLGGHDRRRGRSRRTRFPCSSWVFGAWPAPSSRSVASPGKPSRDQ